MKIIVYLHHNLRENIVLNQKEVPYERHIADDRGSLQPSQLVAS